MGGAPVVSTQAAHLFSEFARNEADMTVIIKEYWLISTWEYGSSAPATLLMFGLKYTVQELIGGSVNMLENILTLSRDLHEMFDHPNTYRIVNPHEKVFQTTYPDLRRQVIFAVDSAFLLDETA
jgi:hypothetical protein